MTQNPTQSPSTEGGADRATRHEKHVGWATGVGLSMACVAMFAGIMVALQREPITCPDGTFFPKGTTDFECYAHPQGGVGIAIASLSVGLAMLIILVSIIAKASLRERPRST